MTRPLLCIFLLLLAGLSPCPAAPAKAPLKSLSLPELEQHLTEIDSTLEQLSSFTARRGTGSKGYRSQIRRHADAQETIRIELGEAASIDQIVLVPSLYLDTQNSLRSASFPIAFRILVGDEHSTHEVASFSEKDHHLPRIAPLAVSFPPLKASWIAIEATLLSTHNDTNTRYSLELTEVLVFSGLENVAQKTASRNLNPSPSMLTLTDGFTPFLMDAAQGKRSQTKAIKITNPSHPATLTLDLKSTQPIDQVNLHTSDAFLAVPMPEFNSWGTPRHIRVIGANKADFSDETFLCEVQQKSIYDHGPILTRHFPETKCRYIRLEIIDPHSIVSRDEKESSFAFSEIEVLCQAQNIAAGASVNASEGLSFREDTLERITDGHNNYGKILPLRDWMNQLALRHDLEKERPLVVAELQQRYARQKINLRRMGWIIGLLAAAAVIGILIERLFYLRKMQRMRTRFAADLHDELGANLHTIALLSDAANVAHESTEEWQMLHRRIRDLVGRTGTAIRHFSNIVNPDDLYEGLVEDMKRLSRRILAKLEHSLDISGEEYLEGLKVHTQVDLYLFYKESLMNICRHSNATQAKTLLTASPQEIVLTISDNGKGLPEKEIPTALTRRARLLKAKLTVKETSEGGTSIKLRLRKRKSLWPSKSKYKIHNLKKPKAYER